jgi:hypothetical protein
MNAGTTLLKIERSGRSRASKLWLADMSERARNTILGWERKISSIRRYRDLRTFDAYCAIADVQKVIP